jgi:thiosulfate/3-mercaptopyruvate sulfurtransferase
VGQAGGGTREGRVAGSVEEPVRVDRPALPPFVTAAELAARRAAAPDAVVLVDVRWSLDATEGYDTYLAGHLPGAVFVDLDEVLADPPSATAGRHPLPTPARFAAGLGAAGIGPDDVVVAYDQGPGTVAARLVWLLRVLGQPAAVLEGGLATWDGPREVGEVRRSAVAHPPRPWPADRLADADRVARAAADPAATVVDARDPARFRGELEPVDPRAGHVPGAVNLPASANVGPDARLWDREELRRRYRAAGALDADEVIAYCGSGVTAAHDLLVLELLGVEARLYPGSWSAWSADRARPVATGD